MEKRNITVLDADRLRSTITELELRLNQLHATTAEVAEMCGNQWHDNAAYDDLVMQTRGLDKRVSDYRQALNDATIVALPKSSEKVVLGTDVEIDLSGEFQRWSIVGYDMGEYEKGLLAYNTPFARHLIGMRVGESRELRLSGRTLQIKVIQISISQGHEKSICGG